MGIDPEKVRFDASGLVPAVVQDARTREVLTLAYMNRESLARTIETGETWFWSRSRNELWHKGVTSGNTQAVVSVVTDCDSDTILVLVEPAGPACHTGARSCFAHDEEQAGGLLPERNEEQAGGLLPERDEEHAGGLLHERDEEHPGGLLHELYALIQSRREERPEGSYTTYLFDKGLDKILKKVGEESAETIIAAKNDDPKQLIAETADLLYHLLVMLVARDIKLDEVRDELAQRRKPGDVSAAEQK